jgi:hypothetical protein
MRPPDPRGCPHGMSSRAAPATQPASRSCNSGGGRSPGATWPCCSACICPSPWASRSASIACSRTAASAPIRSYGPILLICGPMAIERTVITWAADHLKHHALADQEGIPTARLTGCSMPISDGCSARASPASRFAAHLVGRDPRPYHVTCEITVRQSVGYRCPTVSPWAACQEKRVGYTCALLRWQDDVAGGPSQVRDRAWLS